MKVLFLAVSITILALCACSGGGGKPQVENKTGNPVEKQQQPLFPPVINEFKASKSIVNFGEAVDLSWDIQGVATTVQVFATGSILGHKTLPISPGTSNLKVFPVNRQVYTLVVSNSLGKAEKTIDVTAKGINRFTGEKSPMEAYFGTGIVATKDALFTTAECWTGKTVTGGLFRFGKEDGKDRRLYRGEIDAIAQGPDGALYSISGCNLNRYTLEGECTSQPVYGLPGKPAWGLTFGKSGAIYVTIMDRNEVYRIEPDHSLATLVATVSMPKAIVVDKDETTLYVSSHELNTDINNYQGATVEAVDIATGTVRTFAGKKWEITHTDGPANEARFITINGIAYDEKRNCLWLGTGSHGLRKLDLGTQTVKTIGSVLTDAAGKNALPGKPGGLGSGVLPIVDEVAITPDGDIVVTTTDGNLINGKDEIWQITLPE